MAGFRMLRKSVAYMVTGELTPTSRSIASTTADRSWPRERCVRSDAWILAMSNAAPTPLPETSPPAARLAVLLHELVEEVAADFPGRHRRAFDFRQADLERLARQHVVLNLSSELELALDALLIEGRTLVSFDVVNHLVERPRQVADLVVGRHGHPRYDRDQPLRVVRSGSRGKRGDVPNAGAEIDQEVADGTRNEVLRRSFRFVLDRVGAVGLIKEFAWPANQCSIQLKYQIVFNQDNDVRIPEVVKGKESIVKEATKIVFEQQGRLRRL